MAVSQGKKGNLVVSRSVHEAGYLSGSNLPLESWRIPWRAAVISRTVLPFLHVYNAACLGRLPLTINNCSFLSEPQQLISRDILANPNGEGGGRCCW